VMRPDVITGGDTFGAFDPRSSRFFYRVTLTAVGASFCVFFQQLLAAHLKFGCKGALQPYDNQVERVRAALMTWWRAPNPDDPGSLRLGRAFFHRRPGLLPPPAAPPQLTPAARGIQAAIPACA
jgi:hypothetical protein